jgi:hypothetical protein
MGARDREGIENAGGVGNQVGTAISRVTPLVGDRTPGVAVVVADNEPTTVRKQLTETLLPPHHRRPDAHDEQDRRMGRVAKNLGAQPGAVCLDHLLGHLASTHARWRVRRPAIPEQTAPRAGNNRDGSNDPLNH